MPSLNHLVSYRRRSSTTEPPADEARPDEALADETPAEGALAKEASDAVGPAGRPSIEPPADAVAAPIEAEPEAKAATSRFSVVTTRRRSAESESGDRSAARSSAKRGGGIVRPGARWLPVALAVLTVLLGGLAVWFGNEAGRLRGGAVAHNTALTDTARTSEVKGTITDAINVIFSYDYADMAKTEQAAGGLLTGKAVRQYAGMLAAVREQAPKQKLVLNTTVTDSGVELLDGDRARLLIFADQRSIRTGTKDTTYAAAMLAIDAVRQGGKWKISNIDTLGIPR